MTDREWTRITLDPCAQCGAHRWTGYPSDDEGRRMVRGECNRVVPMEFRMLAPLVGQD